MDNAVLYNGYKIKIIRRRVMIYVDRKVSRKYSELFDDNWKSNSPNYYFRSQDNINIFGNTAWIAGASLCLGYYEKCFHFKLNKRRVYQYYHCRTKLFSEMDILIQMKELSLIFKL